MPPLPLAVAFGTGCSAWGAGSRRCRKASWGPGTGSASTSCSQDGGTAAEAIALCGRTSLQPTGRPSPPRRRVWGKVCATPAPPLASRSSEPPFSTRQSSPQSRSTLGLCKYDPPAHKRGALRRKGAARVGFPIISKRSPRFGRGSVSPHAAGPPRVRAASAGAALRNKFALCLGRWRQLLKSMSDQISAVADSLSLHIFMSVKKREAQGS